ncbi:gamma-glutamyl-gamma-aminobutyrate hydrolase family protein [Algoriphagus sp. AGSA1]|uniref:anthranilate synthase component II n=1 Tax=Algoriphagus sp. AGSA1 TaxID=2907213 RepID=UPI001F1F8D1A|nr:gamma-glutamyl-gamma-aminobutyrate hydrolase family protein [Algoriphagus sp. AGSA1]MCE7056832.1 gamma-glutamyl-gamma-aminobutyrate hydrolase family protein [Algoriphagus sp. AGSA1]
MLLLLDNFDSFSHMLADLLRQSGEELQVLRNDVSLEDINTLDFGGLVLSPGPGVPQDAGNLMSILAEYYDKVPILGVCLGHQAIGEFFGARLKKNAIPTHGKVHEVHKTLIHPYTAGIPDAFMVTRYHSLQLTDLPEELEVILETESGEVMGIAHRNLPILGIQYHPEAYLTEYGLELVKAWGESINAGSPKVSLR